MKKQVDEVDTIEIEIEEADMAEMAKDLDFAGHPHRQFGSAVEGVIDRKEMNMAFQSCKSPTG